MSKHLSKYTRIKAFREVRVGSRWRCKKTLYGNVNVYMGTEWTVVERHFQTSQPLFSIRIRCDKGYARDLVSHDFTRNFTKIADAPEGFDEDVVTVTSRGLMSASTGWIGWRDYSLLIITPEGICDKPVCWRFLREITYHTLYGWRPYMDAHLSGQRVFKNPSTDVMHITQNADDTTIYRLRDFVEITPPCKCKMVH